MIANYKMIKLTHEAAENIVHIGIQFINSILNACIYLKYLTFSHAHNPYTTTRKAHTFGLGTNVFNRDFTRKFS